MRALSEAASPLNLSFTVIFAPSFVHLHEAFKPSSSIRSVGRAAE